jgi:hypothetical protein
MEEGLKKMVKELIKSERGAALILALILLLVGGLITAGLLGHMGAGLLAGETYNRRTAELYAADAGVEDAMWRIQHGGTPVCPATPYWSYNIPDINGKRVDISIEYVGEGNYRIRSIAATCDGGNTAAIASATTVESYVSALYMDFSALLDNAIVSYDSIDIQPNNYIGGDIWLPDEGDLEKGPNVQIDGEVNDEDDFSITWPTAAQLSTYYYGDVEGTYDPGPSIDVKYTNTIGPCYRDGSLTVDNTGNPATLVLDGTVYVREDAKFAQAGSHDYTLDLNGHTIFAEGNIDFPSNVSVSGSGCIIAVGYVNFQPSITGEGDDFILVMSITDMVEFHPSGDFTGCIAGNVNVQLQPGGTIDWISPEGKGLDFPMGVGDDDELPPVTEVGIESWEISQQ